MVGDALCKPSNRPGPGHPASEHRAQRFGHRERFANDPSTPSSRVQTDLLEGVLFSRFSLDLLQPDQEVTMRLVLIFLVLLVLGFCDAARRTATAARRRTHLEHPRQQRQDSENVWDLVELQKLDNNANIWNKNPSNPSANVTELQDSELSNTRQLYPSLPNPGETNELPGPITAEPIPMATPPPGCLAPRGQFPSARSCSNYLNCWDDTVVEQSCPDGLLFNDVSLVCDYDYNVNCGDRPKPTPRPSLSSGAKLCPEPNGRYRSATNCSEFYVCVYRKPIKFACSGNSVYNDVLGVCDYPYNVDCKGAVTPSLPPKPTTSQSQPPSQPATSPAWPSPPSYGPLQPSPLPAQPPSYGPSQLPSYGPPQPPQPSQSPQPPQPAQSSPYGLSQFASWHQRPVAAQLQIEKDQQQQQQQMPEQFENPWNTVQNVPPSLSTAPCNDGDVHRLNDFCTNVVVCRNGRPQLLRCSLGYSYDTVSDSCKPISIAKC